MEVVFVICLLCYIALVGAFIVGFLLKKSIPAESQTEYHHFSILIPFRNEASQLKLLLDSLLNLDYPKEHYEIILINDESTDDFSAILTEYDSSFFQCIDNRRHSKSPKKDALETGINRAQFPWIVSTDADCILPKNWLQMFNQLIAEKELVFIGGPVIFKAHNSFLFHMQQLNLLSLMGCTIGGFGIGRPIMCSGANLCFSKEAFFKVGGYKGNNDISSGDDVFLLEKMIQSYPDKIDYLKSTESIVLTSHEKTWKAWFQQQFRWASKSRHYTNLFTKMTGLIIYTINLLLFILLLLVFLEKISWTSFILFLITKTLVDVCLLLQAGQFFKNYKSLIFLPVFILFYPVFIVGLSLIIPFRSYKWKGRKKSTSRSTSTIKKIVDNTVNIKKQV